MAQIQETFLFQPTQVPGCQLWLDAADSSTVSLSGLNVTQWNDKSGNGRNAIVSSNAFATYSNTALYFTNSLYTTTLSADPTNETSFLVFNNPSGSGNGCIVGAYNGGRQIANYDTNNTIGVLKAQIQWGPYTTFPSFGTRYITTSVISPSAINVLVNGGTTSTSGSAITFTSGSNTLLGREVGLNFGVTGFFHEFIVYNSVLTTAQRQQIEGYLAWKWGLQGSLPSTHPYKTYRPLAQTPFPTTISPMPTITQGTAVFDPRSISGCVMWLDATDPNATGITPANGTALTQWRDKSSNRLVGTAINSPTVQTNVQNGLPVVRFNGTNQYINFGNVLNLGTNSLTMFVLTKFAINAGNQVGILGKASYRSNPGRWALVYDTVAGGPNGIGVDGFIDDTGQSLVGLAYNPNTAFTIFCNQNNRTTSNRIYYNGNLGNTITFTASANNLSNTDPLYVAAYPDGTGSGPQSGMFMNGDICEIVVYFSNLSDAQRQQVEGYLAWKWGLTSSLPNGHPYKRPPLAPFSYPVAPVRGSLNQWIPTQISGSQLWLDASDRSSLVLSGTTVSQWNDKSGNGRNTSATSGTSVLTTNAINRLSAVYFNNTAFGGSFSYTGTQLHCFVVGTMANNGNFNRILSVGNGSQNDFDVPQTMIPFCRGGTGTTDIRVVRNNNGISVSFGSYNTPFIAVSAAYANTIEISVNGATPSPTASGTSAAFNTTTYGLGVNTGPVGEQTYVGYIGEMIIYNSYLSVTQRQQVEGYLAWKWGLQGSLPGNHPFRLFPPSP